MNTVHGSVSLQLNPDDPELKLMSDTLHLSGPALRHEPRQLASQIVGRLQGVITLDTPKTRFRRLLPWWPRLMNITRDGAGIAQLI